jgi:carbamoyl-phosphate synthase large subunit
MDELIVGVSGINAVDNPGPGIGVARSLKEAADPRVMIVGLAYDAMEPGIYMDWVVDKSYVMPYPSGGGEAYVDRLLHIKRTHGLDFVIPNLDVELPVFIHYADVLEANGIGTFLPGMAQFRLRGKDRLEELACAIGIRVPRTKVVASHEALASAVAELGVPVMVKGIYYKAQRASTLGEAHRHCELVAAEFGYPVIVQEVVVGDELNVVGLGDGEGAMLGAVGLKKIMTTALGKVWTGVTVRHERMLAAAERFVARYKWRGPFELECMLRGDDIYLIEINPRFPAWSYLATGVGINLPSRMLRRARGLPVPENCAYEAGKLFIRYSFDLVTDMDRFQKLVTRGEAP